MTVITVKKSKLKGTVTVSGAKNSVLRLLAASVLTSETLELGNYPDSLLDQKFMWECSRFLEKNVL
jgi:UDP-N-acetylglucosamine 1-carboxyvinyltransferase